MKLAEVLLHEFLSEVIASCPSWKNEAKEEDLQTHNNSHQQNISVGGRKGQGDSDCCCQMTCVHPKSNNFLYDMGTGKS